MTLAENKFKISWCTVRGTATVLAVSVEFFKEAF